MAPHSVGVADLRGLAAALEARIGLPVSGEAVTAYLESQGWSDADARFRFGCADLAALGTRAWEQSWTMLAPDSAQRLAAPAGEAVDAATTPLQGVFFLALALIQLVSLAWSGITFGSGIVGPARAAAIVMIGVLLGLVWANGFSQLLAREPYGLHQSGQDARARAAALRIVAVGVGLAVLLAVGAILVSASRDQMLLPIALAVGHFWLVVIFWMAVAALFALGQAPVALTVALLALVLVGAGQTTFLKMLPPRMAARDGPGAG